MHEFPPVAFKNMSKSHLIEFITDFENSVIDDEQLSFGDCMKILEHTTEILKILNNF